MKVLKMHCIDIAILFFGYVLSFGLDIVLDKHIKNIFMFGMILTLIISIIFKVVNIKNLVINKSSDKVYKIFIIPCSVIAEAIFIFYWIYLNMTIK